MNMLFFEGSVNRFYLWSGGAESGKAPVRNFPERLSFEYHGNSVVNAVRAATDPVPLR